MKIGINISRINRSLGLSEARIEQIARRGAERLSRVRRRSMHPNERTLSPDALWRREGLGEGTGTGD